MWQAPIQLYRAGRETVMTESYKNDSRKTTGVPRVLIKHTLSGGGTIYNSKQSFNVPQHHVMIIERPSDYIYQFKDNQFSNWEFEYVSLTIPLQQDTLPLSLKSSPIINLLDYPQTRKELSQLIDAYLNHQKDKLDISAHAYQLFIKLIQLHQQLVPLSPKVRELKELIQNNFEKDINVQNYCKMLDRSPESLIRKFKEEIGTTPLQYILNLRINKAKVLIEKGYEIKQVSKECGFLSTNYFHRAFKKNTGITPSIYKSNNSFI